MGIGLNGDFCTLPFLLNGDALSAFVLLYIFSLVLPPIFPLAVTGLLLLFSFLELYLILV